MSEQCHLLPQNRSSTASGAASLWNWLRSGLSALLVIVCGGQLPHTAAQESPIFVNRVTISLVRQAPIAARDAGLIDKIPVTEGRTVKAGEIIAELDSDQQKLDVVAAGLNLQVAALQAADNTPVETATAQLHEAKSGRVVKEIALKISETEAATDVPVQIASAETRLRELELARAEGARESFKGSISESHIDRLKTSVEKGKLEIRQAQDAVKVQQMKPDAERAAIAQKDDEIQRYTALVRQGEKALAVAKVNKDLRANELEIAELNLERRRLRAPFAGVIVKVNSSKGEWVEQGTPVARIIDLTTLQAEGFLPAAQARSSIVGRPVSIRLSNLKNAGPLRGTVVFVSPEVDPVNQQVRFKAEFRNVDGVLPGMNGTLTIEPASDAPVTN